MHCVCVTTHTHRSLCNKEVKEEDLSSSWAGARADNVSGLWTGKTPKGKKEVGKWEKVHRHEKILRESKRGAGAN